MIRYKSLLNRIVIFGIVLALSFSLPAPDLTWAFNAGDQVEVLWSGVWYPASVVKAEAARYRINYDGYDSSWDEWVGPDRIRAKGAAAESREVTSKAPQSPGTMPDWKTMTKDQIKSLSARPEITPDPKAAMRRLELGLDFKEADRVEVLWFGWWTEARILKKKGDSYLVRFKDSDAGYDEWVGPDRLRHMLWKDTFVVELTQPNPSLVDPGYRTPVTQNQDPVLPEVVKMLRDLAKTHPRLAEELGRLPDLHDGITAKEKAALQTLMDLYNQDPKLLDRVFQAMDQIGLPQVRRYNAPLQALFWLNLNTSRPATEKLMKNYTLRALLDQAWNVNQLSLWRDLDQVADRLNAPELVNYFVAKAFVYNWDYFGEYLEPKNILEKRTGVCVHFAAFGTHCLARAGYDPVNYSVFWGDQSYRTGHVVTVIKKNDLLYIVVDSEKPGRIQGPYKKYDDIAAVIARGPVHIKKVESNAEMLYYLKGEYMN